MNMKFKTAVLFVAAFVAFASCKQAQQGDTTDTTTEKLSAEEVKAGIEEVIFPLPEPMGVYNMLENIGATYVGKVLNPVSALEGYHSSNIKAANLGVYAADLSYATVYENKKATDEYSQALKVLIDDLDIKIDYKSLTSEETKSKVENTDSLIKLTTDVFLNTYDFLYKESDPALAALMVNGFYIEGLYIATHISEDTYDNTEMVKIIYSQAKPLEKILELNSKFENNQYIATLQSALTKLKALYETTDGSLTKEQLEAIATTIKSIRDTIVS